jgi:hypothetical protein
MGMDYMACGGYGVLVDYMACGVYGVLPDGPFFERFLRLWAERLESMPEGEDYEDVADRVLEENPELLEELRGQYRAPDVARMFWTGSADDRPGRCATPPEGWVFGVGLYVMHRAHIRADFAAQAEYHTWVLYG